MSDTEKTDDLGWYTPAVLRRVLDAIESNTDPDGCGVKGYAWVKNSRLKYVNVHIDTRDMHVLFTDRDRKPVDLAELMDTFAPESKPAKPARHPDDGLVNDWAITLKAKPATERHQWTWYAMEQVNACSRCQRTQTATNTDEPCPACGGSGVK